MGLANTVPSVGNIIGLCTIVLLVDRVRKDVLAVAGAALVLLTVPLTAASPSFPAVVFGLTTWVLVAHITGRRRTVTGNCLRQVGESAPGGPPAERHVRFSPASVRG